MKVYKTENEFFTATANYPSLASGFRRIRQAGSCISPYRDLKVFYLQESPDDPDSAGERTAVLLLSSAIECIPILSTFFGVGRFCAVWCVKGFSGSIFSRIYHTIVGVLGILGLGIIMFILRIIFTLLTLPFWLISCLKSSAA